MIFHARLTLMAAASLFVTACGGLAASSSSPGNGAAQPQPVTSSSAAAVNAPQSTLLRGNAHPHYPAGTPGRIGVVYQAPIQPKSVGTLVPIVLRNNTSAAVAHVQVSATAKDQGGKIVASGSSQGTDPSAIEPGQWALAYIYFEPGSGLAPDDTLSFTFQSMPASTDSFNTATIQVTQANLSGSSIAGGVQNTTGHPVQGPISIHAYCLSSAGDPTSEAIGFTSSQPGDLAPNAADSFQLNLSDQECASFLIGASGYYK
jgi:hypothetical protein